MFIIAGRRLYCLEPRYSLGSTPQPDRSFRGFLLRSGATVLRQTSQETDQLRSTYRSSGQGTTTSSPKWRTNSPLFKFPGVMLDLATHGGAISPQRPETRLSTVSTRHLPSKGTSHGLLQRLLRPQSNTRNPSKELKMSERRLLLSNARD